MPSDFIVSSLCMSQVVKENAAKAGKVLDAKPKLLGKSVNGNLGFSHWQTVDVTLLCRSGTEPSFSSCILQSWKDHLQLIFNNFDVQGLHSYMGLVPEGDPTRGNGGLLFDGTVAILARPDEFVATVFSCLCHDGTDIVGGHCQKVYCKPFWTFFPVAYDQVSCDIRVLVQEWCPKDFNLFAQSVSTSSALVSNISDCKMFIEVSITPLKKRLKAILRSWFREYITTEMGASYDC